MFLLQLNSNNVVISRTSLMDTVGLPLNVPLGDSRLITNLQVEIGQVYDPVLRVFETPVKRWISKLAFDNRFTMQEAVALKLGQVMPTQGAEETAEAYQARCVQAASLQVLQSRLNMASYIDLDRADTRAGVQMLESAGLLAAGRALEILDTPIADHETYPAK